MDRRSFIAGSLLLAGCQTAPKAKRKIAVGLSRYPSQSPFYAAIEKGYFAEEGLELDLQILNSSAHHIPLLVKGDLEVSLTAPGPALFNAVAKGGRIRLVCGREEIGEPCHDTWVVFAREDRFPQKVSDLKSWKGKKIGVSQKAGLNEFLLDWTLEAAGLESDAVERVYIARNEAFGALKQGLVDALIGVSGDGARFNQLGPGYVRDAIGYRIAPHFQYSHVIFGGKLLDDLDAGAGFVSAYMRGVKDCLAGFTPQFLKDYAVSNKVDLATLTPNCVLSSTPDGAVHTQDVEKMIDWGLKRGYIEKAVDVGQVVDTRFWEAARKLNRKS